MAEFIWKEDRKHAAQLIAEGEFTDAQICEAVGIVRQTLWEWRKIPEFNARVDEQIEAIRASLKRRKIALVEQRVDRLNRDWLRLSRVLAERATDPDMAGVPGGETGLMVRKIKSIGIGDNATIVNEYEVDTGTLNEMRKIEEQAAKELGQWVERTTFDATVKSYDVNNSPDLM